MKKKSNFQQGCDSKSVSKLRKWLSIEYEIFSTILTSIVGSSKNGYSVEKAQDKIQTNSPFSWSNCASFKAQTIRNHSNWMYQKEKNAFQDYRAKRLAKAATTCRRLKLELYPPPHSAMTSDISFENQLNDVIHLVWLQCKNASASDAVSTNWVVCVIQININCKFNNSLGFHSIQSYLMQFPAYLY